MDILNISRPGQIPVDGDVVEYLYTNGATERKVLITASVSMPAPVDPCEWLIDIGPFFDRFGAAKMAILKSIDADVKAFVLDATSRKWIDLKRADVDQALLYLVSTSLITSAQKTAILTAPVALDENRALRRLYF